MRLIVEQLGSRIEEIMAQAQQDPQLAELLMVLLSRIVHDPVMDQIVERTGNRWDNFALQVARMLLPRK